jgi:2-polyprenyl-3-methyl-5-hydroxy-6-metoxy-1,4-benzoquinol methylase
MSRLVPDQLKEWWQSVEQNRLTSDEFTLKQTDLLAQQREVWTRALVLREHTDLKESLLAELDAYFHVGLAEVKRRCRAAVDTVKDEWTDEATRGDVRAIVQFYDQSPAMIYELMWWHTLDDDQSPLAYVTALEFARQHGCRSHLDFGAGVGAGSILFARNGLETASADISTTLQTFSQWRMDFRKLPARFIDLKTSRLPDRAVDFVTAMDVFEHLPDPVATVEALDSALRPGGYLFARLYAEKDEQRPQHIVMDFAPTFHKLDELGFVEVWRDEWLWGHQVYQKR